MGSTVQQHHVHAVETVGSDTSPLQQNTSCTATRLETSGSLHRVSLGAIREQDVGADATQQSNSQLGKHPDERMTTGVGTSPRRKHQSGSLVRTEAEEREMKRSHYLSGVNLLSVDRKQELGLAVLQLHSV